MHAQAEVQVPLSAHTLCSEGVDRCYTFPKFCRTQVAAWQAFRLACMHSPRCKSCMNVALQLCWALAAL